MLGERSFLVVEQIAQPARSPRQDDLLSESVVDQQTSVEHVPSDHSDVGRAAEWLLAYPRDRHRIDLPSLAAVVDGSIMNEKGQVVLRRTAAASCRADCGSGPRLQPQWRDHISIHHAMGSACVQQEG